MGNDDANITNKMSEQYISIAKELPPAIAQLQFLLESLKDKIIILEKECSNKPLLESINLLTDKVDDLYSYYQSNIVKDVVNDLSNIDKHDVVIAIRKSIKDLDSKIDKLLKRENREFEMHKVKWRGYLDLIIKFLAITAAFGTMYFYGSHRFASVDKKFTSINTKIDGIVHVLNKIASKEDVIATIDNKILEEDNDR